MDGTPIASWIAGGGAVALFALTATILFRSDRRSARIERLADERLSQQAIEIREMRQSNARCERRVSVLIWACQQGGIQIPAEVWGDDGFP